MGGGSFPNALRVLLTSSRRFDRLLTDEAVSPNSVVAALLRVASGVLTFY